MVSDFRLRLEGDSVSHSKRLAVSVRVNSINQQAYQGNLPWDDDGYTGS